MISRIAIRAVFVSFAVVWCIPAVAQKTPPLVERAFETMKEMELDDWSYTMTTAKRGIETVERHDVTRPEGSRWQLLKKDGRSPTAEDLSEYNEDRKGRDERKKERDKEGGEDDDDISSMVEPGSVTLLSENETRATYRFRMKAEDEDERKFADNVRGTLVVDKSVPYIERIEMQSTGEIKPATGVKIAEFRMSMSFRGQSNGTVLPITIDTLIKGRAFLVKKIDEDVKVSFSEFEAPSE